MLKYSNRFFQAGGSLSLQLPSYIERQADHDLYQHLKQGNFCYVLTARQMGKSSLKVRTMNRLAKEDWVTISIDLTSFGTSGFTAEQWYLSFLVEISDALGIDDLLDEWWSKNLNITPVARLSRFWEEVLLKNIDRKIVLFIDEIDSILSLKDKSFSSDDFFAAIRAVYNKRSEKSNFERLNFAIFGVATPEDLIENFERTPFNIGISIPLNNFTSKEVTPLKNGFLNEAIISQLLLDRIIYWTAGQPYLTQELGQKLSDVKCKKEEVNFIVDKVVETTFFKNDIFNSSHFNNIQTRILANEFYNLRMLDIYKSIIENKILIESQKGNEQLYLKLSGLVKEQDGKLEINNLIYESIFDKNWINKVYESIRRPFLIDLQRWLNTNKSDDVLLKGSFLEKANNWAKLRKDLSHEERDFLEASRLKAIQEVQERLRLKEKIKQQQRLRVALGVIMLLAVLAITSAVTANKQAVLAQKGEQNARIEAIRADSLSDVARKETIKAEAVKDSLIIAVDSIQALFNLANQRFVAITNALNLKAKAESEIRIAKEQLRQEELEKIFISTTNTIANRKVPREKAKWLALHSIFERKQNPRLSFQLAQVAYQLDPHDYAIVKNLMHAYYDGLNFDRPIKLNKDKLEYPLTNKSIFNTERLDTNQIMLLDPQGYELYTFAHNYEIKKVFFTLDHKYLVFKDSRNQLIAWAIDPDFMIRTALANNASELSNNDRKRFKIN